MREPKREWDPLKFLFENVSIREQGLTSFFDRFDKIRLDLSTVYLLGILKCKLLIQNLYICLSYVISFFSWIEASRFARDNPPILQPIERENSFESLCVRIQASMAAKSKNLL